MAFFSFVRFYFIFNYVYVCLCRWVCVYECRGQKGAQSLWNRVTGSCELPAQDLGTKLRSSATAASAFKYFV